MIEFINVTKVFPNGVRALRELSFSIAPGEFVFLIGASGAGKTTISKLLLSEEHATSGKIIVDDTDLASLSPKNLPYYRRKIGFAFQDYKLFPNMNVYDNISFAMKVVGKPNAEIKRTVATLLELFGLEKRRKSFPRELSGGEQQRVALARALANKPKIILADEPTGNLDPKMSREIMDLLMRINERGTTVIVITHEKSLVDLYRRRVIAIKNGRLVNDAIGGTYSNKNDSQYLDISPQAALGEQIERKNKELNMPKS